MTFFKTTSTWIFGKLCLNHHIKNVCFYAKRNKVTSLTSTLVCAGLVSTSAYGVEYYGQVALQPSTASGSPAGVCSGYKANLEESGVWEEVGDYRLVPDINPNGYDCYVFGKHSNGNWLERLQHLNRIGDGCKYVYNSIAAECVDKNQGTQCATAGNPISVLTGYKYQYESDYQNLQPNGVSFHREYNHLLTESQWRFPYQQSLDIADYTDYLVITAFRPNGHDHKYARWVSDGSITNDPDIQDQLVSLLDGQGEIIGWQLALTNNAVEDYDINGKLTGITYLNGQSQALHYDLTAAQGGDDNDSTLDKVEDYYGQSLFFSYDANGQLETLTNPEGETFSYSYDANGMLLSVTYPDDTPTNANDNPQRIYHYEDTNFPTALTGITDEKGNRFATWTYDAQGRAISSEHAGSIELETLDYTHIDDVADPRVTVTNALGKQTTYHYTTLHGVRNVTQVEGHTSANCAAANQNYTHAPNGYLDEVTDWEGTITDYDHNARGLEIQRIEAKGTPEQRTITTQWHADYRLPTKITESDSVIEFTYDAEGLLLERKETPLP